MSGLRVTRLHLDAFKTYRDQVLELQPLTLLVGPNASGKSNAIDALTLLALLADERDVRDVERGDESVSGLRGGLTGAAPFGESLVAVGCTVASDDEEYDLRVTFDAGNVPDIVSERLTVKRAGRPGRTLVEARRRAPGAGLSDVSVYSGGAPRTFQLLSSRLSIVQAAGRIPQDTKARQQVVEACRLVTAALRGVFVLDPVPGRMRDYVPIGSAPDRSGVTTSALAYALRDDPAAWLRLAELVNGLVETDGAELAFFLGGLSQNPVAPPVDVMVGLRERAPGEPFIAQARVMSDGTLRYLAIVCTLLTLTRGEPALVDAGTRARPALVVEEIENGLFPTQASRILDLLRSEAVERGVTLLATTHSPALLDALHPDDHPGVVLCRRDAVGRSSLTRLIDHERYVSLAGGGALGTEIARTGLGEPGPERESFSDLFAS